MKSQSKQRERCAVTGAEADLNRVPFKNKAGYIVGYVFLSQGVIDDIDNYQIDVNVNWKHKKTKPSIIKKMPGSGSRGRVKLNGKNKSK